MGRTAPVDRAHYTGQGPRLERAPSENDGIEFRVASSSDMQAIATMIEPMYAVKRRADFYAWHVLQNVSPTSLVCAFHGNEAVGVFGIRRRMLTNHALCGQIVFINVAPQWQGKGLFTRLSRIAMRMHDDVDLFCIFANATAKDPCERSLGFRTAGTVEAMALDLVGLESTHERNAVAAPVGSKTSFFPVSFLNGHVSFEASPEYRRWRYSGNPMYSYYSVTLPHGEYAVVKLFGQPESGTMFGDIVDFEADWDKPERVSELFLKASLFLRERGASKAVVWTVPGTVLNEVVQRVGFAPGGHGTFFSLKVLTPAYDYLYDLSRWHLRMSDATNY